MTGADSLTELLRRYSAGDFTCGEVIFRSICSPLREVGARILRREWGVRTFLPSDLVTEAWLRLYKGKWGEIRDRHDFYAIAAKCMERAMVDAARRRKAQRRNAGLVPVPLDQLTADQEPSVASAEQVMHIHELMQQLRGVDAEAAEVVSLHYIMGLSFEEITKETGYSPKYIRMRWERGKNWLGRHLRP